MVDDERRHAAVDAGAVAGAPVGDGAVVGVRAVSSDDTDPVVAAGQLVAQLGTEADLYLVFVASPYPVRELGRELGRAWGGRMIGCTSAGNLGPHGYEEASVTAVALSGGGLRARTVVIEPLDRLATALEAAQTQLADIREEIDPAHAFAVLLVDGLSRQEEHLAASLGMILGDVPLVGGSAGDDLTFQSTEVLCGDRFRSNAATVTVVSLDAPFQVFRVQHFEPGESVLVITDASPGDRIVRTINGMPAATAYAQALGLSTDELDTGVFSAHPVTVRAGGQAWVRSVARVVPGGGLAFYAAIDTGAVLRPADALDPVANLRDHLEALRSGLGAISGMLAFDCILRRVEFRDAGQLAEIGDLLRSVAAAGFSTYGEQFGDFHINQTMVGVAFGAQPDRTGASR